MLRYLLSFFLFSGGGHIDQNGIFDYNVKKKKKKTNKKKPVQLQGLAGRLKYCSQFTQQASYLGQLSARWRNAITMAICRHADSGPILRAYWVLISAVTLAQNLL